MTLEDLWLSSIHPCSCGEGDEAGAFTIEGNIFGIQRELKGLNDIHTIIGLKA
jgi:hypothetical protein